MPCWTWTRRAGAGPSRVGWAAVLLCGALGARCGSPAADGSAVAEGPAYLDVARSAGITHVHQKPLLDSRVANIMPWLSSVGAAVAAGDFDDDGRPDLYVTSSDQGTPNYLYRNLGEGKFEDVAERAGLAHVNDEGGVSMAALWTDVDNDGRQDLYLVRWGTDRLFRNDGDGTFTDVTRERFRTEQGEAGTPWANGNAVIALDYDLDGRVDLYVGNYFQPVNLWRLSSTRIMHDDFETSRNGGRNFLYHQEPDGTFTEVAARLGVDDPGWTLAVGAADVNNDGHPDLYVANDFGPDRLYFNDGAGGFVDVSETSLGSDTKKGMNVDFGDFNNDGWLDIYVTNITTASYLQEGNMLWRNNGPGPDGVTRFMDVSSEAAAFDGGWGWGAKFLDYDNDGDLDLFSVNGFVSAGAGDYWYDLASWTVLDDDPADALHWPAMGDRSFSGYEPDRFWRNEGFESFREIGREVGLASERDGRGIAVLDHDADGDLDLFVANQGQAPHLYENRLASRGHWLRIRLVGDPQAGSTADALGARVTVVVDGATQIREREGGAGFAGQSEARLHFGLGAHGAVDLLEVRWPDGGLQYLENVTADRDITVRQDPQAYAGRARVAIGAPRPSRSAHPQAQRPRAPQVDPVELERLLATLEAELRRDPARRSVAYEYRRTCREHERAARPVAFFGELVDEPRVAQAARLELALAYVDKIPSCGGLAAIVCKGTQARKSLDALNAFLEREPQSWIGHYARGMNHLHWPRALRHSRAAVADFSTCLELQRASDRPDGKPYYERIYVLLGDAHAKHGAFDEARRVWSEGRRYFSGSKALVARLAIESDSALLAHVEQERSLEQVIDTDLSFAD